jgi:hypothetical protein
MRNKHFDSDVVLNSCVCCHLKLHDNQAIAAFSARKSTNAPDAAEPNSYGEYGARRNSENAMCVTTSIAADSNVWKRAACPAPAPPTATYAACHIYS